MKTPGQPPFERDRIAALLRTGLLDTAPEERFDRFTRMARRIFKVPIALVSFLDSDRQWFKSRQGLTVPEAPRDISFCGHAILQSELFIIEDTRLDERFADNPLVTGKPHIRFYAGAPLLSEEGYRLGTLCVLDVEPRQLDYDQQRLLLDLADSVTHEIKRQYDERAFQELSQRERRARAIIEGTHVGTWEWNVQTGEAIFNELWANICGYRLEELEPVNIQTWLGLAHPDDLPGSEQRLEAHFAGASEEYDYRCRMRHKEGHWVWVHDRGRVFEWTKDGAPLWMYGTHADVTREMDDMLLMEQQNRALGILNDLALDRSTSEEQKLQQALRQGAEFLRLPTAMLSEITGNAYMIKAFHAPADSGLSKGDILPLDQTYCSILLDERDHLAIPHMGQSPYRAHPCYGAFELESYIAAPIRIRGQLHGTLHFSSPEPRDEPFSETEIAFVTLLAKWTASLLDERLTSQTLNKLVNNIPGALYQYRRWPDGSSTFPYASPGVKDLHGVSAEDLRAEGMPVFNSVHPYDLQGLADSIDDSERRLSLWLHQYRVKKVDGWHWVEGRASPEKLADGSVMWHGYITDIDERKRNQLLLQESEDQLRRLFEQSPTGIGLLDYQTGEILDANETLMNQTGYDRNDFMSLSVAQLVPRAFGSLKTPVLRELRAGRRFGPYEHSITRADGTEFPAIIQGLLITNSAGRALVWTLVEDISERKRVERMKNEFISTVSHELRTPLTSIAGSLGLIAGGALGDVPEKVKSLVTVAARNSDQLRHLIDDLLDMEKLVSGQMDISPRPTPVEPLIRETMDQLRTYAVDKGIRLTLMPAEPDIEASVDGRRLIQALANLLSNAIKFSPSHGEVNIVVEPRASVVTILIEDQGPGIPDEFRARIFQKFAQADSSVTRDQRGTGLGLTITREIMTQMGGRVGFESESGSGATFWLEVPR